MSGIVGSKLNIRGSGRVAKLGTDGQVLTSSGAGKPANYEAGATSYDDDAVRDDIATLALHQATNANAAKYNLVNTNVDQYEDSTGIATFTDCSRDSAGEYVSTSTTTTGEFSSDSDTQLLMHYDGADGSTTMTDSSSNASTFYANGNAQLDTAYKKFGTASLLVDGSGDFLQSSASLFDAGFGTDPFTIEFWYRPTAAATTQVFTAKGGWGSVSTDYEGWVFRKDSTGYIKWHCMSSGGSSNTVLLNTANLTWTDGTWYHVTVTKDSSDNYYIYRDGVSLALTGTNPDSDAVTTDAARDFDIGKTSDNGSYLAGHLDEFRISTVCRYPAGTTFTPNSSTTLSATGNYISTATTANASVSSMGAVITYKNQSGTNTLNTDIILEVSADSGSNYTTCVLAAAGTFSTGILQAVANDLAVTAGTGIQYRLSFANQSSGSLEARIYGASLMY